MKTKNLRNHVGHIMRTIFSLFLLQLAAIVGLTAIARAQTDLTTEHQEIAVEPESSDTPRLNASSSSILKKLEDWVGLTNTKLEDLAAMVERLQVEIAKRKTQHSEATSAMLTPAPLLENPVDLPVTQNAPTINQAEIDRNDSFDLLVGDVGSPVPLPVGLQNRLHHAFDADAVHAAEINRALAQKTRRARRVRPQQPMALVAADVRRL